MNLADVLDAERSEYRIEMMKIFDSYIHSEQWQVVVAEVKKRDNNKCVDCGKLIKEGNIGIVHHTRYDNWGKGNYEEIQDCVYLCEICHSERHKDPEMRRITPFWAKARYNLYDSYYSMAVCELVKEKQQHWFIREEEVRTLLYDLCGLSSKKYKRDEIRNLVLRAAQILYKAQEEGLIDLRQIKNRTVIQRKQLRDKRLTTTQIYSDLTPEQVREAYENRGSS